METAIAHLPSVEAIDPYEVHASGAEDARGFALGLLPRAGRERRIVGHVDDECERASPVS
jgi:hypothetical protein